MPVPLLPQSRLRMITEWLRTYRPQDYRRMNEAGSLEQYVKELDHQMYEEFLNAIDDILNDLIREKIQGTPEGLEQYQTRRRDRWNQIVQEYLPTND
jgi:hypothetical protein